MPERPGWNETASLFGNTRIGRCVAARFHLRGSRAQSAKNGLGEYSRYRVGGDRSAAKELAPPLGEGEQYPDGNAQGRREAHGGVDGRLLAPAFE